MVEKHLNVLHLINISGFILAFSVIERSDFLPHEKPFAKALFAR
jgi:hypothetical protein